MATAEERTGSGPTSERSTFQRDVSIKVDDAGIGAASISPSGRDVVLASKSGLFILDLDNPYSPPRHIVYRTDWDVADVQWSPFASRAGRIATTANQKALIFNLDLSSAANKAPVEFTLHAHERAITDINFSAHHADVLATCAVDSYVLTWDLRAPHSYAAKLELRPYHTVADFQAGATQVKWNRQNEHLLASSHDKYLHIWDTRKGAVPVTTITAHQTKIYGIDWHRADPSKILTCSLDKTIKLWDQVGVKGKINNPCQIIRTNHPVWRARHTPFPNGVLAMPQRGSSALNLYTHSAGSSSSTIATPAHSFQAHEEDARVQEFLWRTRGTTDNGIDNREFQLVSWGTDKHLHLYTVSSELLFKTVGYQKGDPVKEAPSTTRKGAKYVTYRDDPPKQFPKSQNTLSTAQSAQQGALSSLFQSVPRVYTQPSAINTTTGPQRTTMTAGPIRHSIGRVVNKITWMEGVKVGERRVDKGKGANNLPSDTAEEQYRWTIREDLASEVSHVGKTYTKVTFEHVGIPERRITVSFQGPWGDTDNTSDRKGERKLAFLRLTINFPEGYPHFTNAEGETSNPDLTKKGSPLEIEFHKTTAAIDDATFTKLKEDMNHIANHRASLGCEALDAIICYGLGERGLEDSLMIPGESGIGHESLELEDDLPAEESSSDEDDEDDEEPGLGIGQDIMNSSLTNANVPLPITCSTRFSAAGVLALVRMPSVDPSQSSTAGLLRLPRYPGQTLTRNEIFESFGRLNIPHDYDSESPTSSTGSWDWTSSPSSSSGSENEAGLPQSRFQPPIAWQNPALRFQSKTSHPSSVGHATKVNKPKPIVSILASLAEEFVPSKRCLAEKYRIFGDGPQVCLHNADVARRFGFEDLADIWELCRLILNNEVPLEILPQQHRREQVLVLARRAIVRIKRKDSGLDLQFDEADTVTNPKLKGRIKWGHHSVVTWLIPALFEHFEKLADIQMLAMLSCVFAEPAAREGVTSAMAKMRHSNLPMSMEAPAFSLDYFSSADAAWSMCKPTISMSSTPAHSRYATPVDGFGWHRLNKNLDTYGSHGSSNGPWGSDAIPSEPVTPYSTGNSPPNLSRASTTRSTTTQTPYSTSPEQTSHVLKKSSTANFASAFATLSRPFANVVSSSPPIKSRIEADLSTSAPTSGVTWGTTTFYSSGSQERNLAPSRTKHGKRASFGQTDRINIDYYSDSDSEYGDNAYIPDGASEYTAPLTPNGDDEGGNIRVTLKNQDKFDDEGCVSAPLLDMGKEWLYRAWREQYAELLNCWGLVSERAEILKFNGLMNYFPPNSQATSKAGSIHLALKPENGVSPLPSPGLSRASTLAPPGMHLFKRSPTGSPREFSFNPEANEFTPGLASPDSTVVSVPPDVFISSEQYLRLSIPTPVSEKDEGGGMIGGMLFDNNNDGKLLKPRPSMSRNISKSTSVAGKKVKDPIYSCSICWIRVSGRFFLCPSCGHVAHFDCMDSPDLHEDLGHGWEEGECVVGCGCGCGFEEDDYDEQILDFGEDAFRRWDERGGWLPQPHEDEEKEETGHGYEGGYGEGVGRWSSPSPEKQKAKSPEKDKEKEKEKRRKSMRRAVSALSYY